MTPFYPQVIAKTWCVHLCFKRGSTVYIRFSRGSKVGTRLCITISVGRYVWLGLSGGDGRGISEWWGLRNLYLTSSSE